jgi:hypothetical protein
MSLLSRFLHPVFPHAALRHCVTSNMIYQYKRPFPFLYICTGVPSSGKSTFVAFATALVPSLVIVQHGEDDWVQTVLATLTANAPVFLFIAQENLDTLYQTFPFPDEIRTASHLFVFESTFAENPVGATEFFHDIHMKDNIPQLVQEFLETY